MWGQYIQFGAGAAGKLGPTLTDYSIVTALYAPHSASVDSRYYTSSIISALFYNGLGLFAPPTFSYPCAGVVGLCAHVQAPASAVG